MNRQYRQGDVLLCAIDSIPDEAKPVPHDGELVVVAQGELTGHAHVFAAGAVRMFRDMPSGRTFLLVTSGAAFLRHEEHDPILVPAGHYEIRRQRDYLRRAARFVAD